MNYFSSKTSFLRKSHSLSNVSVKVGVWGILGGAKLTQLLGVRLSVTGRTVKQEQSDAQVPLPPEATMVHP
jgi:hypothetical protein